MAAIAFCFLVYDNVQHSQLWESFFFEMEMLNIPFNIYTHPKKITKKSQKWIIDNEIEEVVDTEWGDYSLLEAPLLLFEAALKDKSNKYIVLLSGSDIPLHRPSYIYEKMKKDNKSHLDMRYFRDDEELEVWGNSLWMYVSRKGAKDLVRLLDENDKEAQKFLDFWKVETDIYSSEDDKVDCKVCGILGPEETIPVNWFIHIYGSPSSKTFKDNVDNSCVTYAYFKDQWEHHPEIWTIKNLKPYRIWEMSKCLFGRKFKDCNVIEKVFNDHKFSKEQINKFRLKKKKDGPESHWGQPMK